MQEMGRGRAQKEPEKQKKGDKIGEEPDNT